MARDHAASAPIDGKQGPLSAERSTAILNGRKSRGTETNIFDVHLAVDEAIAGSPLTAGNKVELLQDGSATYKAMISAVSVARDNINTGTYILSDDEVAQRFVTALIAKQQEGVQVNPIRDSVGTLGAPTEFFSTLSHAGINILQFNPGNPLAAKSDGEVNQRDHRKLPIVEGRVAFLAGVNINSVSSGRSFSQRCRMRPGGALPGRDTDLQLEGPVVDAPA